MSARWTDERVAVMRRLHARGDSAREIANQLGGTSRSAVCGKLARLGLKRERVARPGAARSKKATAAKVNRPKVEAPRQMRRNRHGGPSVREAEYVALRQAGVASGEAGARVGVGDNQRGLFEKWYRAAHGPPEASDLDGLPAFAEHDPHVSAVIAAGGFLWRERGAKTAGGEPVFRDARGARVDRYGEPLGAAR